MRRRTASALLISLLLAAVPATALADGGAGDNQYQDPLATAPAPKKPKKTTTTPATTVAPVATSAPAATTTAASTTSAGSTSATPTGQLPRTGSPAGLVAALGAGLVGSGLILRRRSAAQ